MVALSCANSLAELDVEWVEQAEQLGTGHAVAQAMPFVDDDAQVLVLYGDVPLIQSRNSCQNCATCKRERPFADYGSTR